MGCNKYYLEGISYPVAFSEMNDDIGCLCTFPLNDGNSLNPERVRSLAYLGAAVVMLSHERVDHGYIPHCLPDWMRKEIDRIVLK